VLVRSLHITVEEISRTSGAANLAHRTRSYTSRVAAASSDGSIHNAAEIMTTSIGLSRSVYVTLTA